MKAERAVEELESLKDEVAAPGFTDNDTEIDAWDRRVRVTLVAAFGEKDHIVSAHDAISYNPGLLVARDPDAFPKARKRGIESCRSNIEAALYRLRLEEDSKTQTPSATDYDPDLWAHVSTLVEHEEWDKVPAEACIFLEHRIRTWVGNPAGKDGSILYGQPLMALAFGDDGPIRLGTQSNEIRGWRNLAIGFTQAISNVARHRTSERDDARQYAIGVLGLASLLLIQARYEHCDLLTDS